MLCVQAAEEDGFIPLFDGKTTAGWHNPYTWGKADVVDGEIRLSSSRKFFLTTDKTFANFVFEAEVLLPAGKANSGFMFRAHQEGIGTPKARVFGYQAEVDGDMTRNWSGGLYDEGRRLWFISPQKGDKASVEAFRTRAKDAFKRNEWNKYRITCQGKRLKIEINGVTTTDVEDAMDASGYISIQHHGEKGAVYRLRNLRIKELK